MHTAKSILFIVVSTLTMTASADTFFLPELKTSDKSYVKSINIAGLESVSENRGVRVNIPAGSYSGSMECVVDGKEMKVDVNFESKGQPDVLFIFSADKGCGITSVNQKTDD